MRRTDDARISCVLILHRNKPNHPKVGKRTKRPGAVIHAIAVPLTTLYPGRGVCLYGGKGAFVYPFYKERKMPAYRFAIAPDDTRTAWNGSHAVEHIFSTNCAFISKPRSCEWTTDFGSSRTGTVQTEPPVGSAVWATVSHAATFIPPVNPIATITANRS